MDSMKPRAEIDGGGEGANVGRPRSEQDSSGQTIRRSDFASFRRPIAEREADAGKPLESWISRS